MKEEQQPIDEIQLQASNHAISYRRKYEDSAGNIAFAFADGFVSGANWQTKKQNKSRCCGRCDGVNDLCITDIELEEWDETIKKYQEYEKECMQKKENCNSYLEWLKVNYTVKPKQL